ncbi:YfhO family protein [Candidatus Nitrosocosmicus sp. SS]|jgi:hypothetical protein|uniref:YfhO family protein n=1 Tax=Candidatus Nitrosocosmicus agrestis TaxID=2563600 RepID=UPI00122E4BCE|nr:YfhO family protein [Candidatus Nitrosocosmicus sp. SS]KAA2279350.1 YfhO family protein [Candidatus Nitrosocosmicus sp. SS]KAF0867843.1 YfhO family protein [Candidatus Nitrosocosmicus sp. SS]
MNKFLNSVIFVPTVIIVLNILIWSNILFVNEGVIIQRDFNFPYTSENFVAAYYPIWNHISSQSNIENLPRTLIYLPFITLAALGIEVTLILKILIIATFTFLTAAMYLFGSNLLKRLDLSAGGYKLIPLASAFIFAYNPISLLFSQSISLIISLGALSLLLYFILTKINSKYFPLYATLALLLSVAHPFNLIMNVLIGGAFLFAIYINKLSLKRLIFKGGITAITFLLIFSWFILPYISNPISSIDLGRESMLARPIFQDISHNNPLKITLLERDKFLYTNTSPVDFPNNLIHYICLAALVLIGLSANFYRKLAKRTRYLLIFFSIGFVAYALLAMGDNGPIGDAYYDFIAGSSIGWIFRSPLKFQMYQLFFIIPLFMISLALLNQRFLNKRNNSLIFLFIVIPIFLGSSAYGIYDANVFTFKPIKLPDEYYEINELLKGQDEKDLRILYYPLYREIPTEWSQGHYIAPYEAKTSQVPTFRFSNNYNYLLNVFYDYPYKNNLFSSSEYYDLVSSLGAQYIVFHDDRNEKIDQENLHMLLRSKEITTIYAKNGWYLFKILNSHKSQPYLVNSLALVDTIPQIYPISSPGLAVATLNDTDSKLENADAIVKLTIINDTVKSSLHNILTNTSLKRQGDQLQATAPTPLVGWFKVNDQFAESNPILISNGKKYLFEAGPLSNITRNPFLQVLGYNISENAWQEGITGGTDFYNRLTYLKENEPLEYKNYSADYWRVIKVPDNITQIKFVVPAQTLFGKDNISMALYNLDGMVSNASSVLYHREDPTTLKVRVNATSPSLLIFPETYDKGWKAIIGNQSLDSVRMFGSVNAFPISKGNYDITIKYEPQKWLDLGIFISVGTIILYLIIVNMPRFFSRVPRWHLCQKQG